MKAAARQAWIAVDQNSILCNWCRYADWIEDEAMCVHPLIDAIERSQASTGMEPGDSCWGFRPQKGLTLEAARDYAAAERGG